MDFKTKIYKLRKKNDLSQEKLAEKLNISRQAIAKWENGETYPDIDNLISLSNLFNISIDRLLKDANCINNFIKENIDNNILINFLITAKKNTYAGKAKEEDIKTRPN